MSTRRSRSNRAPATTHITGFASDAANLGYPMPDNAPWQFLYFLPEPHGHGSLRPIFRSPRTNVPGGSWAGGGAIGSPPPPPVKVDVAAAPNGGEPAGGCCSPPLSPN